MMKNQKEVIKMKHKISEDECRMLLQEANLIRDQYPDRIQELKAALFNNSKLIKMSTDISSHISSGEVQENTKKEIKDLSAELQKSAVLQMNIKREIFAMDNQLLQLQILKNLILRLPSTEEKVLDMTYFKRMKQIDIQHKLFITRSTYYRAMNTGIKNLTKLYNQNMDMSADYFQPLGSEQIEFNFHEKLAK